MKNKIKMLEEKRSKLLKELGQTGPFIAGSLSVLHRICGTKTCRCMKGGKKHKAMYFCWKKDRKTQSFYVPAAYHKDAHLWVINYRKVKRIIKELSYLQQQIIKNT